MIRALIWLLRVAIFILSFVWVRANLHDVPFFWGEHQLDVPLASVVLLALFCGVALGFLAAAPFAAKKSR